MTLAKRHRLRADPAGNLEIIDAFWHLDQTRREKGTAPTLLVYADLLRTREPRNAEAAVLIRDKMEQVDDSDPPQDAARIGLMQWTGS